MVARKTKPTKSIADAPQEAEAWVAFLDVYGFSNFVAQSERTATLPETFQTLQAAHTEFAAKRSSHPEIFFLSDNIFLVRKTNGDNFGQFQELLADIRVLMDTFVKRSLPLRGGVAFGSVLFGPNLLIGSAVARAVDYEKAIHAPLVIVPERELADGQVLRFARPRSELIIQLPDRSLGLFSGLVVRPGNQAQYKQYALQQYRILRRTGPARAALAWKQALDVLEIPAPTAAKARGR